MSTYNKKLKIPKVQNSSANIIIRQPQELEAIVQVPVYSFMSRFMLPHSLDKALRHSLWIR